MSSVDPLSSTAAPAEPGSLRLRLQQRFVRLPFRTKLTLIASAISVACLLLASIALGANELIALRGLLLNRSITLADIVAANSEAALSFEDRDGAEQLLATLRFEPAIVEARLLRSLDGDGGKQAETFARYSSGAPTEQALPLAPGDAPSFVEGHLHVLRPVLRGDETIGQIYLRVELSQLQRVLLRFLAMLAGLIALTALVSWVLARRLQGMITRPVTELLSTAESVRHSKDYSHRARVLADDELGELTQAVNAMLAEVEAHDRARARAQDDLIDLNEKLEGRVRDRTQDLQASNLDLQEAIDSLRRAQGQLVESEKMVSLGGLVAGVAHEINTPIGICVTVASHLGDRVAQLKAAYTKGIRRTDLETFIADSEEAVTIVNTNLLRAAELIRSFKRVAVDQESEERRRFKAADYIAEVLTSLSPRLKRSSVEVELDCDVEVELDSYPGVIAQIVTNLVFNALIHAFGEGGTGRITIIGQRRDGQFELSFADNGCGMEEDVRGRVFDPFFTTRRAEGGSGLGLHITYNQVTQQLGGSIRCESERGQGTRFVLLFPLVSPRARKSLSAPAIEGPP